MLHVHKRHRYPKKTTIAQSLKKAKKTYLTSIRKRPIKSISLLSLGLGLVSSLILLYRFYK